MFDHVEAFYRPTTVPEALRLLKSGRGRAHFVAGGTDVVAQQDRSIRFLVDLTRLGLGYIRAKGGAITIGATTTMAALEDAPQIRALANGILSQAAATCGSVQLRNMATVGGNIANASPAADTATPLLALDAVAVLAAGRGRRKVALSSLFAGPHKTALNGSLLVELVLPPPARGGRTGWSFLKLGRTESDISLVNVAAGFQLDAKGGCRFARIALGAVAPTPMRAVKAEELLVSRKLDTTLIDEVSAQVAREVRPISDVRAPAEYRREMSRVLTGRALRECAARAGYSL